MTAPTLAERLCATAHPEQQPIALTDLAADPRHRVAACYRCQRQASVALAWMQERLADEGVAREAQIAIVRAHFNPAAEDAVIGAAIDSLAARKEARRIIDSSDFLSIPHGDIWDAMSDLDRANQPVDLFTVRAAVESKRGATDVLIRIVSGPVAIPQNIASYASTVRSWATRRRLDSEALHTRQMVANPANDAAGLASAIAARFAQVRDTGMVEDTAVTECLSASSAPTTSAWQSNEPRTAQTRSAVTMRQWLGRSSEG